MLDPPRKRPPGPAVTPTPPVQQAPPPGSTARSIPDPYGIRSRAQARIRAQDRHRRVCRELEQLASLVEYYCGPRRSTA
jgi:hypothetical protein